MQVKNDELIPILVAHGIGVNVDAQRTNNGVSLDRLGKAIGYMLENEVQGHGMVKDMAMLIARMSHRLRETDSGLAIKAMAYLARRDLITPGQIESMQQDAISGENRTEGPPRERRAVPLRIPTLGQPTAWGPR